MSRKFFPSCYNLLSEHCTPVVINMACFDSVNEHECHKKMKGTKVQTLGGRAVAGAWLVAWAIMAMGAIINTHAHR